MATHDYVIDNSTGANVRADINNVLQAILTNNSSSSAPSTTAAYMWWADTTTGTLKIRNSANNAWVELLQLDGTLTLEDGSASTPALAFRDDLNTGIFSSAADTFNVATGGVERMELGATTIFNEDGADVDFRIEGDTEANLFYVDAGNNRIGIGTSSPSSLLTVSGATPQIRSVDTDGTNDYSTFQNSSGQSVYNAVDNNTHGKHLFQTAGTERMRIDSSGRLLLGTSSARAVGGDSNPRLHIEGTGANSWVNITRFNAGSGGPNIQFGKSRSDTPGTYTVVQDGDNLGQISFLGADGTDMANYAALIRAEVDGTPGSNDMPGRLVFSTTADGGTFPTERMRIDSSGNVNIGVNGSANPFTYLRFGASLHGAADIRPTNEASHKVGLSFYTDGTADSTINPTERMRIDSSGNVGIGTTPDSGVKLHVQHDGEANMILEGNVNGQGGFFMLKNNSDNANTTMSIQNLDAGGQGTSEITFQNVSNANNEGLMMFKTRPSGGSMTERMRIDSGGKLLHGCTSATGGTSEGNITIEFPGNSRNAIKTRDTDNNSTVNHMVFVSGSSAVGTITGTTGQAFYNNLSDYRSKENDVKITDGIEKIKLLRPIRFNYKVDKDTLCDGFFAHEVTPAVPTAVTGEKDAVDSEGKFSPQMLDTGKIIPLLTAALQEEIAKREALETRVAALEAA